MIPQLPSNVERAVRNDYHKNVVYRLLKQPCDHCRTTAPRFRLSAEQMFVACFDVLDRLKEDPEYADEVIAGMWNELIGDCCDLAIDATDKQADIETAAGVVTYALYVCLTAVGGSHYLRLARLLMLQLNDCRTDMVRRLQEQFFPQLDVATTQPLCQYMKEYMASDAFISDDIEDLITPQEEPLMEFSEKTLALFNAKVNAQGKSGQYLLHWVDRPRMLTQLYHLAEDWNCDGTRWKLLYLTLKERSVMEAEYTPFVQYFVAQCNTVEESDIPKIAGRIRKNGMGTKRPKDWTEEQRSLKKRIIEIIEENMTNT